MGLLSLPPALRLQMWTISPAIRSQTAGRLQYPRPFSTGPRQRATINTPETDRIFQNGNQTQWKVLADVAEKAVLQQPGATQEEKREILKALGKSYNQRQRHKKERDSFKRSLQKALKDPNVVAAISQLVQPATLKDVAMKEEPNYDPTIIPQQEQYPDAPRQLFTLQDIATAVHNLLAISKIDSRFETTFTKDGEEFACALKIYISGICNTTLHGRAASKQIAKRNAFVALVNHLHSTRDLERILPQPKGSKVPLPAQHQDIELVEVEPHVMNAEKNAKMDVYNYAAKYGLVPRFESKDAKRKPVTRQAAGRQRHPMIQVSIQLTEQDILVSRAGKDPRTAEVAAALAFKNAVELKLSDEATAPAARPGFEHLSTETAQDFVFYYLRQFFGGSRGGSLDVESEIVKTSGHTEHSVRVLIEEKPVGLPVRMFRKKDAEKLAFLVAAVTIANEMPEVLKAFVEKRTDQTKKSVVRPMEFSIDAQSLNLMRETLVSARRAGLPDERETLTALERPPDESRSHWREASTQDRDSASERLLARQQHFQNNPKFESLRTARSTLPMSQYRQQVLDLLSDNVYSIVIGATGSGKTTQVPQIILDHAVEQGEGGHCDIICTQPRRLAASSVAQRVAAERGENIGATVGYHVRGNARLATTGGSITYCTTGILVEQLKWNPDMLEHVSHLIIDEVHERDIFVDFLLIILKKAIKARQEAGKKVPKVILMSATLDADLFSGYLRNQKGDKLLPCPALSVPGRTFPVKEKYLQDILGDIRKNDAAEFQTLMLQDREVSGNYIAAEQELVGESDDQAPKIDWKRVGGDNDGAAQKMESMVPISLIAAVIAHIVKTTSDQGAILVFLPGVGEITQLEKLFAAQNILGVSFTDPAKFTILPLHSAIPPEQQGQILDPVGHGCRKIILSTNIAETSVTVPDVKHVVDSGKMREKRYDQFKRISSLETVWESGSNARQRAGRAGRVSDGNYYAVYSRARRDAMAVSGQPELLRCDLQETCLAIKTQGFKESVSEFLSAAVEPPAETAVTLAVEHLKAIEALTEEEGITSLGRILSRLPVHPIMGKMVLLGIIFRCLDPMIIISSMGEERSLFVDPPGHRRAAKASRAHYVVDSSDHLGFINAFKEMRWRMNKYGQSNAWEHGQENFIHFGVFRSILFTTQSIKQTLVEAGLIEEQFGSLASSDFEIGGKALNTNSGNVGLVKGLLLAGLYPNIGVRAKEQRAPVYKTMYEDKVWIHPSSTNNAPRNQITFHPSSMNNALTPNDDSVYTYGELARSIAGDTLFMRNTTPVTPLMGILFGGRIATNRYAELMMDDWLVFKMRTETFSSAPKEAAQLTLELRKAKDRMLNGVFASLHENGKILAHDPPRELLVSGVAALLEHQRACEQYGSMEPEVPSGWMEWGAAQDKTTDRSRDQATTAWRGRW